MLLELNDVLLYLFKTDWYMSTGYKQEFVTSEFQLLDIVWNSTISSVVLKWSQLRRFSVVDVYYIRLFGALNRPIRCCLPFFALRFQFLMTAEKIVVSIVSWLLCKFMDNISVVLSIRECSGKFSRLNSESYPNI